MVKKKVAFVGVPCQIQALKKMNVLMGKFNNVISIALFCRENWSYGCMRALVEDDLEIPFGNVRKFDIKRGKFVIKFSENGEEKVKEIPLQDTRPYVRINCHICLDFLGELADIDVGSVGSETGYSTVITRTRAGKEIVESAAKSGYIELSEPTKPRLVRKISQEKKQLNREEAERREMRGIEMKHIRTMHEREIKKLLKNAEKKQFSELEFEVIDVGSCTSCGACAAACPIDIIRFEDERPYTIGECKKDCNLCYIACPRTFLPLDYIEEHIDFVNKEKDPLLGRYERIYAAKAKDRAIAENAQDGGAVTALLKYMLDNKIVDAVLTVERSSEAPWKPKPVIVESSEELLKTAKTVYSMATTMQELRKFE